MYCSNCGKEIDVNDNYCPSCGKKVNHSTFGDVKGEYKEHSSEYISLTCKSCGGTMNVDKNREIYSCPYCGAKMIHVDSDEVKKVKIKTEARHKTVDKIIDTVDKVDKRHKEAEETKALLLLLFFMMLAAFILIFLMGDNYFY